MLNQPITNFAQMKTIIRVTIVQPHNMYTPALLIRAIDFLADNTDEQLKYSSMTKPQLA